ncbi:hypothetical protein [Rhodanobacter sp. L36]|uniref:hypothetical protein n=1 Tax=Rhodanobacter sp. L36 TaxID=1747221 RepID=UPI00131DA92B|nr:hypothetical protein [Rhodanobacter sp. L36]
MAWTLVLFALSASAQTNLPGVNVTAPLYTTQHGGYLISGDFKVDPRMPSVIFPAQALVKDDILSVEPIHLNDDEYLVIQECITADCSQAAIVRVWDSSGANIVTGNSENRIWIKHENKYFIWLKRLPEMSLIGCQGCDAHFTTFQKVSPPLVLIADGEAAAHNQEAMLAAEREGPLNVVRETHEGSTFVVAYAGGSTIRIRRMHATK